MAFSVALKIETDGALSCRGGELTVEGASEAVLFLTAKTSFVSFDVDPSPLPPPEDFVRAALARLSRRDYPQILARHLEDVRALLSRSDFALAGEHRSDLPTEERLKRFDGEDVGLYELLFAFGRYLTVASSRAGTQATNLQGIWNEKIAPPWSSNYTININTEMNYWPTLPASLAECYEPYIALAEKLRAKGAKAARDFYGAGGFVSHHNTDLWGMANPVGIGRDGRACVYSDFPFSSAWIASQLYDYYEYTLDERALARIYPILTDAAAFYLDLLTEDEDGGLIFSPATSPENYFRNDPQNPSGMKPLDEDNAYAFEDRFAYDGKLHSVARFTEAGQTLMRELFDRTLRAARVLGREDRLTGRIAAALSRLKEPRIGRDGRLLEWDGERTESELEHRHLSHLIGKTIL